MDIRNSIVSWLIKKRYHQIELFMKYPREVQDELFTGLIEAGRQTLWGKKHAFDSVYSISEFKKRFPVQTYDTLKPFIDRNMKGEQNLLWPSEIKWFAKSSGTTSDRSKFIPVSKESLEDCHFKGGKDLISIYYHCNPEARLFTGRGLVLGGSSDLNEYQDNSYYGDLSAVIIKNLPFWAEYQRTPSLETALMSEWEDKILKMAEESIREDVTSITGVPSWTLVLLRKVLELEDKTHIKDVWPNLELYAHGGVSFIPYRQQFEDIIGGDGISYIETYNASEGFIGIQDQLNDPDSGMLLMLDYGIFYEFMPMEELGKEDPETVTIQDVELNKNYALVISTNGGLWRYLLGDTVEFTSIKPYRIKITGRTKHFINAFGEEVIIDNAEKALAEACTATAAIIKEYTAAPIFMSGVEGKGGHEWAIEFEQEPNDRALFAQVLDDALKNINSDYEAKRYKDFVLQFPQIHILPKGSFYDWMKNRGKLGGQNKVPRLSNNRKYIDEILTSVC